MGERRSREDQNLPGFLDAFLGLERVEYGQQVARADFLQAIDAECGQQMPVEASPAVSARRCCDNTSRMNRCRESFDVAFFLAPARLLGLLVARRGRAGRYHRLEFGVIGARALGCPPFPAPLIWSAIGIAGYGPIVTFSRLPFRRSGSAKPSCCWAVPR